MAELRKQPESEETPPLGHPPDFVTLLISRVLSGVFSGPENEGWYSHVRRMWIGASGGLFYSIITNIANDRIGFVGLLMMDSGGRQLELLYGYFFAALVSMTTGAASAWLSAQNSARMLFLIGVMGMTILKSIFFPNLQVGWNFHTPTFVSSAYAQADKKECVGDTAFEKGFKAFFGVKKTYDKYAVVVASAKTPSEAKDKLNAILEENPSLKLRIGPRACDNDFYPVFATDYLPLDDAKTALERTKKLTSVRDAYLSPGPR